MKKILINTISIVTLLFMVSCQEDTKSFGPLDPPENLQVNVEIYGVSPTTPNGDGSGLVKFTATADNAISYKYVFSDGTSANAPSGIFEKRFTQTGWLEPLR